MNKFKYLIALGVMLLLSGCADVVSFEQAITIEPVGFWYGLWHGITISIAFIGSLFYDDIAIYAIYNTGAWYNFGFVLGAVSTLSGSVKYKYKIKRKR